MQPVLFFVNTGNLKAENYVYYLIRLFDINT